MISTGLHAALASTLMGDSHPDGKDSDALWKDFADTIAAAVSGDSSTIDVLRYLYRSRDEFNFLLSLARQRSDSFCTSLAERAIMALESEIELVRLGVQHPHIHDQARGFAVTLYPRENLSLADITEFVKGLHAMQVLRRGDGVSATLEDIASVFGAGLNVDLSGIGQKVYTMLNRSKGPAQFLLRMVGVLEDLAKR